MLIAPIRRHFLAALSVAGAAGMLRTPALAAEGPPETTSVRLPDAAPGICIAPEYVVADLLRAEGFTKIDRVPLPQDLNVPDLIARGMLDFGLSFASAQVAGIDRSIAMKVLAGVHVGCFELFVHDAIRGVADLAGKKVGIQVVGSPEHLFLSVIIANVGIDPKSQIDWVTSGPVRPKQLFIDGKIDAFLGFPPEPQELRGARRKRPPATKVQLDPMPGSFIHFLANHVVRRMIDPDRIVTLIRCRENFPRCRTRSSQGSITRSGH